METDRFLLQIPFVHISDTALHSWRQDWLADTEASLTDTITNSGHPSHDALANRAIVRVHLRRWDVAIDDAEKASPCLLSRPLFLTLIDSKSINICPSAVGYISKSVALIGGGKKEEGCRVFDLAFTHCHPHDLDFLLLVKVCVPRAVKLGCPQPLILPRLLSCLWRESKMMQCCVLAISSLQSTTNQYAVWFRYVVRRNHMVNITFVIVSRRICIFSLGTRIWRETTLNVPYNHSKRHWHGSECHTT